MGMTPNQMKLIQAIAKNNFTEAKKIAIACCEEDTTKKNQNEITYYKKLLTASATNIIELPPNIGSFATMENLNNSYCVKRYYLAEAERKLYELICRMNDVSLQLMEHRIPYLNGTLLYGESGVGKTEFSKYVAYKLGMPYLYVNFSKMCDSYLGGTAKNLNALFSYINQHKCVVMLDEIDSIATKRIYKDSSAGAEISRTTTCLLQLLDAVTNDHVILAATNIINEIDAAVLRRFTQKHEIKRLSNEDNFQFLCQYLEDCGFSYDRESVERYAAENHTQAEMQTHMVRQIAEMLMQGGRCVEL